MGQDRVIMPKLKTHKGLKKRFKVSATGKVSHKRCGSSHLMSHKNGKQVRRLRKKSTLKISAEAHRLRRALQKNEGSQPDAIEAARLAALAARAAEAQTDGAASPA
jgi:large subunit ribosomal protein L35